MIVVKIELADYAHRVMPGLDARELDAFVGVKQFAAGQLRQEVKMPPRAAELAIGRQLQADRRLLVHDLFDLHVLDLAQVGGRYLALLQFGARFLDPRRPPQAADLVDAERSFCSLHRLNSRESARSQAKWVPVRVKKTRQNKLMCRSARDAEKAFEHRGIGFQCSTRRIVDDRAALQYHNAVGEP